MLHRHSTLSFSPHSPLVPWLKGTRDKPFSDSVFLGSLVTQGSVSVTATSFVVVAVVRFCFIVIVYDYYFDFDCDLHVMDLNHSSLVLGDAAVALYMTVRNLVLHARLWSVMRPHILALTKPGTTTFCIIAFAASSASTIFPMSSGHTLPLPSLSLST